MTTTKTNPQLQQPKFTRDAMDAPAQAAIAIDLTTVDFDLTIVTDGTPAPTGIAAGSVIPRDPNGNPLAPRWLWSNIAGKILVVPACSDEGQASIPIVVTAGSKVPFAVRKIIQATSDAGFHNATSLLGCY